MGFFSGMEEDARRRKLTDMENKRLAFAGEMARVGFAPERMLLLSTERGNLLGICRDGGALCLIVGPELGTEDDFVLHRLEKPRVRQEEVFEPATGLGGALGFGTKGAFGFVCTICADEGEFALPVVAHRGGALVCGKKNPLLSVKRRRGDANVVWDIPPIERRRLGEIQRALRELLGGEWEGE